jgi:hypothetical protein
MKITVNIQRSYAVSTQYKRKQVELVTCWISSVTNITLVVSFNNVISFYFYIPLLNQYISDDWYVFISYMFDYSVYFQLFITSLGYVNLSD